MCSSLNNSFDGRVEILIPIILYIFSKLTNFYRFEYCIRHDAFRVISNFYKRALISTEYLRRMVHSKYIYVSEVLHMKLRRKNTCIAVVLSYKSVMTLKIYRPT